jgi:hypothetical protein
MADFRSRHLIAELLADLIPELLFELDDGVLRKRKTVCLSGPVLPVSGLALTADVIIRAVGGLVILAGSIVRTGWLSFTNIGGTGWLGPTSIRRIGWLVPTSIDSTGGLAHTRTSRRTTADFWWAHRGGDHTDSKIADFGHHSSFSLCRMDGPEALLQE